MLKSMTAYGRASLVNSLGHFTVELQSVNRQFLEIVAQFPKELMRFEIDAKKWVSNVVARGQVTLRLSAEFDKAVPFIAKPNLALARQLKSAWDEIAKELQLPPESGFKLEMLAAQEDILFFEDNLKDEVSFKETLHNVINMALEKFVEMKIAEGKILYKDISKRLDKLSDWINKIAIKAPEATKKFRQKLVDRLKEALSENVENNDERVLLREVCLFAERIDITEEITRFQSHIQQFTQFMDGTIEGVGKTLDFLLQEMNREINTIGSKSNELAVSQLVVEIKSELKSIKEQIQNVE